MSTVHGLSQAVSVSSGAGEYMWRYAFPLGARQPTGDIRVHFSSADRSGTKWTGLFECAKGRHVQILRWPEANARVVAAANAVYIVDPSRPEQFSGFAAPVEIDDVTFDESREHIFVADSLRIYAFSSDRLFRWISEPLEGYGAHFAGCYGPMLLVDIKQCDRDGNHEVTSKIRLRAEDGTVLRSGFRLSGRHRDKTVAA